MHLQKRTYPLNLDFLYTKENLNSREEKLNSDILKSDAVDRFFYHPDHLGSTSYVTTAEGNVSQYIAYMPFGDVFYEQHSSSEQMPYKFNAKELDSETGLYYYGARYYDPRISLWLSVDPLVEKTMTPYQYVYQNPIKFIDPTGMSGEDWYRDKSGNYVHDSNVKSDSKLCDGCSYLGEEYTIEVNGGKNIQLNADGSSTRGDTTSYGMEVDYNLKSGNKVYTGVGGSDNSGNAYLNAMNNTTGSQNSFGEYSLARKGWNLASAMGSSLLEGFQVIGFVGYGFGVYVKELATTGKVPTGHHEATFTKWGIYDGK